MQTLEVPISQDDIDNGVPSNCEKCPVARAMSRLFPGKMVTTSYGATFVDGRVYYHYRDAANFTRMFDIGGASGVHPGTVSMTYDA